MNFKNQSLAIFNKGHFKPINREFLTNREFLHPP